MAAAVWVAPQIQSVAAAAAASGDPPTFVGLTSASVGGPALCSNDSVVVAVPAGVQAGDLLLAFVTSQADSTVSQASFVSQGTAAESSGLGVDTVRTTVLTRVATGSEPATYTFSRTSPGVICLPRTLRVVLLAYRGASGIDGGAIVSQVSPGSATSPQPSPSAPTSGPNRTVLRLAGATFRTLGAPTWGTASSGSERTDTGGQRAILVTEATQAVAGATGTATVPQAPAWYGVLWTVALAPT